MSTNPSTANYEYAAQCATKDGFRPGSGAWWNRIRELLPIISEDE